jgi:DNA mismatch repair protein MutS
MLDDAVNNYLCAICKLENETGLCFADVSTSQFYLTAVKDNSQEEIINQLSTYQPREIIVNAGALDFSEVAKFTKARLNAELQLLDDDKFEFKAATDLIVETLPREEIDKLSLGNSKSVVGALGAVIDYLRTVQKKISLKPRRKLISLKTGNI